MELVKQLAPLTTAGNFDLNCSRGRDLKSILQIGRSCRSAPPSRPLPPPPASGPTENVAYAHPSLLVTVVTSRGGVLRLLLEQSNRRHLSHLMEAFARRFDFEPGKLLVVYLCDKCEACSEVPQSSGACFALSLAGNLPTFQGQVVHETFD